MHQTIKMAAGQYAANLTITDKTAIVDGVGATLTAAPSGSAFQVNDSARLRIVGLSIVDLNSTSNGVAIRCASVAAAVPMLELDQVTVDSLNTPILAQPASVTISRSRLHCRNANAGVFLAIQPSTATIDRSILDGGDGVQTLGQGAIAHVTNSVIKNQTGPDGAFIGASFGGPSNGEVFVSYSTIIDSPVNCFAGVPVCAGGSASGSCIDNSIVFRTAGSAPPNTITGASCVTNYTLVSPQSAALTGANNKLGVNPMLIDPAGINYHLMPSSPAIDAANPATAGTADFDGVTRPQGARSDMGAFEYKP